MEQLTLTQLEQSISEALLADKKYMNYTRITLVALIQIGKPNLYIVRKKLQTVLTSINIDDAINKYNSYKSLTK